MKKIFTVAFILLGVLTLSACATRRDQAPEIIGVEATKTIEVGDAFDPKAGVTATDREDGDLTNQIRIDGWEAGDQYSPGTYDIIYSVTDSSGQTTRVTMRLTVAGDVPTPTISGFNPSPTFYIGSGTYNPTAGVTVVDEIDGTVQLEVLGDYNLEVPGTYTIRLRATNSAGGRATVTIVLTVAESDIPFEISTAPITITLWHAMGQMNTDLLNKYARSFEAKMKADYGANVTVVIAESAGNYNTLRANMINAITAGSYPNLVQGYPDHVAEYLNGKVVVNLDPYIHSDLWGLSGADAFEDIIEAYRNENSQYDTAGTFYSLPFNKSTEVMIYNKTVLDELGLSAPTTWQELIEMAPALRAHAYSKGQTAQTFMPAAYDSNGNAFITFTRQFGGAYTSINFNTMRGNYLWHTNPNTFSAMQFLKDNSNILTLPNFWDQQYASTPFVNEQVYITIGSSAGVRYNVPPAGKFEIGVAPVPYNGNSPENRAVIQQGTNISLLRKGSTQEQLVSWLFLKHLINLENTMDWAMATGYLPVRTSAYEHPTYQAFLALENDPVSMAAKAAYQQSGYFFYDPAFVGSSRARTQVGLALERIMVGDGNIQAALDEAYNEANLGG